MKFKALVFIRLRSQVDDSPGNAVKGAFLVVRVWHRLVRDSVG